MGIISNCYSTCIFSSPAFYRSNRYMHRIQNPKMFLGLDTRKKETRKEVIKIERFEGICMMCHKSPIEVRHINLYPVGSEGLPCCQNCENELLEFIRGKMRKAVEEKIKNFRKKGRR